MKSIRRTIVVSVAAAILAVSVLAFVIALLLIRERLTDSFDDGLRLKAEAIASLLEVDDGELELDERDQALGEFQSRKNPSYFEVRAAGQRTVERSLTLREPLNAALPDADSRKFDTDPITLPDGRTGRVGILPIVAGDGEDDDPIPARDARKDETPDAWILVAAGTEDLNASLLAIGWVLFGALALLAIAVVLATPRLVGHGLRPLRRLSDHAGRLNAENLGERFPEENLPEELSPIAVQLNASLDRIRTAFERERRFAADAAHELRTPLASIRTNADVGLRWPEADAMKASLTRIMSSVDRMQKLIERLLEMARLSKERGARTAEPIDLRTVIEASIGSAQAIASPRSVTFQSSIAPDASVRSDLSLLQPLIDNLVNNAAHHADEGSTVTLSADARQLTIANRASELSQADLVHLAEPLWTRSPDRTAGNAGLGLALVAEYARILGIRIEPTLNDCWFQQTLTFQR